MTYREKLEQEHPELVDPMFFAGCAGCPSSYGYTSERDGLCNLKQENVTDETCRKCWDREIEYDESRVSDSSTE